MITNRPSRFRPVHLVTAAAIAVVLAAGTASTTVGFLAASAAASVAGGRAGASTASTAELAATVDTTGFPSGGANPGIFTDTCTRSHTAPDDPIMMPGMPGRSMQHDFFGNPAVTADSKPAQLVGGSTSCSTTADASAYWTPVLSQSGKPLTPRSTLIYWRAPAMTAHAVKTMPAGISMIAGNERATAAQDPRIVDWTCTPSAGHLTPGRSDSPHDCPGGSLVRLVITFPNCWDGHTLDGKQTNVVYATAETKSGAKGNANPTAPCPASHPVQIPQIVMHVAYPTSSGANLTLSVAPTQDGPTYTGHADFMNGWTQPRMDADVAACIDTQTRCGHTSGELATPAGGKTVTKRRS